MVTPTVRRRWVYAGAAILLFITEVLIALYVHDSFVRPYLGDVLVVMLLYCAVRVFLPEGVPLLPLYIFLFAAAVEVAQYLQVLRWLGLQDVAWLRVVAGTSFSWWDMLCYLVGCLLCAGMYKKKEK